MTEVKAPRGFANLDKKVLSDIGRRGGIAAHVAGTAHRYNSESARAAGAKGGKARAAKHAAKQAARLAALVVNDNGGDV